MNQDFADISVIIPAYNRAELIGETLRSLLNQTLSAREIIVVDDGSTDGTADTVLEILKLEEAEKLKISEGKPWPEFKILRQANAGPGAARNRGLAEATGEFIHFFDSDDIAAPNKHEVQLRALLETGADIAYGPWVKGRFGNVTTIEHGGRCEMEQPKVGPKGARVGTIESKSTEGAQGNAQETSAGAAFSHHTTSEPARVSENASLPRFASCHVSSTATSHSLLATPASPEVVFLAFGFIRDNKNLDLVIRALTEFPRAHLIVMGKAQSQKDKPVEFYRKLAEELALSERVKFFDTFVPDEKLASYFAAADVVVLTYDKSFHSQSGVLNVAARARRPVLASAGESPLKDCVEKFRLGVFVEPDDMRALQKGMASLINAKGGEPDWEGYEKFASWDVNMAKILDAVQVVKKKKLSPVEYASHSTGRET